MKSTRFKLIACGALGSSLLAFGACSSGSSGDGTDTAQGDQVQSALNAMPPFVCKINPNTCKQKIRRCVDTSCKDEIKALFSSRPFSHDAFEAIHALQQCAKDSCSDVCGGGGAPGAGGAAPDGGPPEAGGAQATGGAGGSVATGGAAAGGAPPGSGGMATGGAAPVDGGAGGACGGTGGTAPGGAGGAAAGAGGAAAGAGGAAAGAGGAAAGGAPAAGGATATGGAPEAGGTTSTGGAAPGGVDLNGTWISRVQTSGTITAPVVGSTAANIDIVLRLLVQQSGNTLNGTTQICRLNTVTTPNASSLVVTFTPAVLATLVTTVSEPAFNAMIGQPVPLPAVTILTGQDASGNSVDSDMDGNPGVTIPSNVGGILALNAFTGLRINTSLTSTLSDATTITGTASFSSTGTVFGSDNPILTSGNINVTPSSNAVPFTATKLAGDVGCAEVLSHF